MRALLVPLVGAMLAILTACGASILQNDDRAPDRPTVEAGLARLYAQGDPAPEVAAEAECFATRLTDALPLQDLVDAGIVGDDGLVADTVPMLTVDVATVWVESTGSCAPYVEVAARAEAARSPGLDPTTYEVCLRDAIAPDRLRAALVASLSGQYAAEPAVGELVDAQAGCAR